MLRLLSRHTKVKYANMWETLKSRKALVVAHGIGPGGGSALCQDHDEVMAAMREARKPLGSRLLDLSAGQLLAGVQ